ncbi:hypothetical protein B0O80DRAFT_283525 [Mortierella sp. GBAus27b]|nr:hypothetical protein B0O80DRAFT_283525 [Mortierella sp. GBAus27b]
MDLPDPSTPDSVSRNLAAESILDMVQENNRRHIPVFGVSGCGKTRAVIEILSQHWGFYFNAADDDWGSGDMMTLYGTIRDYLKEIQASFAAVDLEVNNLIARKATLLLFLSRLLVFKYYLRVPGSNETFNSARWTLLQSSGSGMKDSSTTFEYLEFPGWTSKESINTYISRVRHCLHDEQSKTALDDFLSEEAVEMLFQKFAGRYRPAIIAIERIVEGNDPGAWKTTFEDVEDRLVSWANRHIKGNLCYEISRLNDKHKDQLVKSIDNMLGPVSALRVWESRPCPQGGIPSVGGACIWSDQDRPRPSCYRDGRTLRFQGC